MIYVVRRPRANWPTTHVAAGRGGRAHEWSRGSVTSLPVSLADPAATCRLSVTSFIGFNKHGQVYIAGCRLWLMLVKQRGTRIRQWRISVSRRENVRIIENTCSTNLLISTLRSQAQSNGPHSNTVFGTLAVAGWDHVTFSTARRSLGGLRPRPVPSLV